MSEKTSARAAGSILTASFGAASPPTAWRFDLEKNHSFTLALAEQKEGWELKVLLAQGEPVSIARFIARGDAEEALGQVSAALNKGIGRDSDLPPLLQNFGLLGLAACVLMLFGLFAFFVIHTSGTSSPIQAPVKTSMAPLKPGMPVSADDVLQPPKP